MSKLLGLISVAPGDSEMSVADDLLDADHLSVDEVRALRRLLSPANVKRIGLGRLPGDHSLKSKGDLVLKSKGKKFK